MAEIRLICPGCAAEYRVPDSAIPPDGREVECSACGNVWHATAQPGLAGIQARADAEPPAHPPQLSRRLPDSVLDILRDEVEHERRARAAEDTDLPAPAGPAPAPRPVPDPEWPATTITRHFDPRPAEPAASEPASPAPVRPVSLRPAAAAAPRAKEAASAPVRQNLPASVPAPRSARGGYGAGMGFALMLAAGLMALYLLAPMMEGQGAFGEGLMDLRADLDGARMWLQDRADALIR